LGVNGAKSGRAQSGSRARGRRFAFVLVLQHAGLFLIYVYFAGSASARIGSRFWFCSTTLLAAHLRARQAWRHSLGGYRTREL